MQMQYGDNSHQVKKDTDDFNRPHPFGFNHPDFLRCLWIFLGFQQR